MTVRRSTPRPCSSAPRARPRRRYLTYRDWLNGCAKTIKKRGDEPLGTGGSWIPVTKVANGKGGFSEQLWRAAADTSEAGYFESVGVTLVGDRMAVTVSLVYGQDYNGVSYTEKKDPVTELPPHPQFGLVKAAAQRLS